MTANQNVSNRRGVTNVIPTASHMVSSTLRLVSDAIQSWIGKPISKRRKRKKAKRLLEEDSTQTRTIPVSLRRSGETRRRVLPAFDTYLLNCDTCDRSYHSQCLQPPTTADMPTSAWRCSFCMNHPETTVSAINVEPPEELEDKSLETQSSISNVRKLKKLKTVENENTCGQDNSNKLNTRHVDKKRKVELGYWTVCADLMPNESLANSYGETSFMQTEADLVSNAIRLDRPKSTPPLIETPFSGHSSGRVAQSVQANSYETETAPSSLHTRKVESGYLSVRTDLRRNENVVNSNGETSFIKTEADVVPNAKRLDRPNITPPLIETPFSGHSPGKVAQSVQADSYETETARSSLHTRKVDSGYLTVRTDLMPKGYVANSYGETSFIKTEADVAPNVIRLDRPNITPPLIETKFSEHCSGRVAQSVHADSYEIETAPSSLHTRNVGSGYWIVNTDLMPNANVPNNFIANSSHKLKNPNTVENENTYGQDNSNDLNTRHVGKKRKVETGYLTVCTDLRRNENVVNSNGETSFIKTEADVVPNAKRLDRPNVTPPLIETPFSGHSPGKVAQSVQADSYETETARSSLHTRKVDSGYLTVRTDLMPKGYVANSYGETSFIKTEADVAPNAIRLDRPNITPPLIETKFSEHCSGRVAQSVHADSYEIETAPSSLHTRNVGSGYWIVNTDLMPNANVPNNFIANSSHKLKNPNTVENENTYGQDNSNDLNTRHVGKKRKVETGYLTVCTDLRRNENVVNSNGETSFIKTEADVVPNAKRLDRPNVTPPLIETPFSGHSPGKVAQSVQADSYETETARSSLHTRKVDSGYLTVRTDLMPKGYVANSYGETSFIKTEADVAPNAKCLDRPNITPPLIETKFSEHCSGRVAQSVHADSYEIETAPSSLHTRKVESGYLSVRTDLRRNENVVNSNGETSFIKTEADVVPNAKRLDRPNITPPLFETPFSGHSPGKVAQSVQADSYETETARSSLHTRKVDSGYLTVRTDLMPKGYVANSYGETSFIKTEADVAPNAIRLDRPNITPPLIETKFSEHCSGRVAQSVHADSYEIETAPSSLHTRNVGSGYWIVNTDLMPNANVPNNFIANSSHKLKNPNTVENENTYGQDNSNDLNTRHVGKKRKVETGYLTVCTDLRRNENVVNSNGETSFIKTEADVVPNAKRLDRPNVTPPLIETPFSGHSPGKVAQSVQADSYETETARSSLHTRKVDSGYLTVRTDLMPKGYVANSYGETSFIKTEADVAPNAIRLDRPNITPPLIETKFSEHCSGRVAQSVHADSYEIETAPSSLHTRKVESGYLSVRTDLRRNENVVNSNGETSFIKTEADVVPNAKRLDRPNITPPLFETPFSGHSPGRVAQSVHADSYEIETAPSSLHTRKVESGYLSVRTDLMPNANVPNNFIANSSRKLKNPKTVENENTYGQDNSNDLNTRHVGKKRKVETGHLTVRTDLRRNENVVNSNGETSFIKTEADVVPNAKRLDRPNITPPLIETPFSGHSSGRVAQSVHADSYEIETAPSSLHTQNVGSGYWAVSTEQMPNANVPNNFIANSSRKLKNPKTVENENTYGQDNSNDLNTRHVHKKRKVETGYLSVRTDLMPTKYVANSYGETSFIKTEADVVPNAKRLDRPNITPPLIETPLSEHCSGRVARSVNAKKSNYKTLRSIRGRSPEIMSQRSMFGTPSRSMSRCDDTKDVLENMSRLVVSGVVHDDVEICKKTRTRSTTQAPERCPAAIQFGEFEVEAWYSSTFPGEAPKLYFCEFCLKFTKSKSVLERHARCCNRRRPPGIEIYRSGDLSVFEVDGHANKTYCQTLCKLGKLFVDSKTMYYGVQQFLFYILTKNDGVGSHVVGYFSKEKYNEKNFNVACVLTMPQYQRQGYGRFLIEFSYLLSITEKQPGTPQKPLSGLGQLSYDSYWKSVILEYLDSHRNSENMICVDDISSKTGLMRRDITNTLQSLNMVVEIFNEITICIDWSIVDAHMKSEKKSKKIRIEPDCLDWTPASESENSLFLPDGEDIENIEKPLLIKCLA